MLRSMGLFNWRVNVQRAEALRWAALAGIGVASLVVYWFGLIRPYSLLALGLPARVDVAGLTHGHPDAQLNLILTYTALLVLYYLAWRLCRQPAKRDGARPASAPRRYVALSWGVLISILAAINLGMLSLYPIGAVDVFDYIAQGRELSVWHGNPFYLPAASFPAEPVLRYTGWDYLTTLYGPAWQLLAAPLTWLAGHDLLLSLLAFKLLVVLFYAGCLAVIAAILRRHAPERALAAVCLFGLNPLVIYETAGNGHNDVVMVFWMLLGFYWLSREHHTLAALSLTMGALTKLVPGFILPVVLVYSLGRLPNWRARLRFFLVTGLAGVLLVSALVGVFWRGGDMFAAQGRLDMFTTSLPAFVEALLEPRLGATQAMKLVSWLSLSATMVAIAIGALYVWRKRVARPAEHSLQRVAGISTKAGAQPWLVAVQASTAVLLVYLLAACLWYQSWYSIWPLALAALLPEGALLTLAVLLSAIGIWKPIYFDFFLNRGALPPRVQRELRLGPAVFGLAWFYAVWALAQRLRVRSLTHLATSHPRRQSEGISSD